MQLDAISYQVNGTAGKFPIMQGYLLNVSAHWCFIESESELEGAVLITYTWNL